MTLRFLLIAAAMVVVALACALVPLLRSARREGRPRAPFWLALVLALMTPPVVLGAYLQLGTPQALQPAPTATSGHLVTAVQRLRQSLQDKPNDAQGWALLSQAYSALNQPRQALAALNHLLKLKPHDPNVMVAWAEASAEANPNHRISDAARAQIERALQIDPTHQRALWLLGISDFQRQRYADAVHQWQTLLPLLTAGSKVAATVQQELADAKAHVSGADAGAAPASAPVMPPAAVAHTPAALNITVKLDPKLASRLRPGDSLYVFARALNGPAMPLAVARLHPSRLPVEVTLTDKMAINPALELSSFARVQVAARISRSGDATPQPGDLESAPVDVATSTRTPIALTIDKID